MTVCDSIDAQGSHAHSKTDTGCDGIADPLTLSLSLSLAMIHAFNVLDVPIVVVISFQESGDFLLIHEAVFVWVGVKSTVGVDVDQLETIRSIQISSALNSPIIIGIPLLMFLEAADFMLISVLTSTVSTDTMRVQVSSRGTVLEANMIAVSNGLAIPSMSRMSVRWFESPPIIVVLSMKTCHLLLVGASWVVVGMTVKPVTSSTVTNSNFVSVVDRHGD